MSSQELKEEMEAGIRFFGWVEDEHLLGVMGIQPIEGTTLIRHAYVLTTCQGRGIGARLLRYLLGLAETAKISVGSWADATWAIRFYEKRGFKLVSQKEKERLLRAYWSIPERQVETSVVLRFAERIVPPSQRSGIPSISSISHFSLIWMRVLRHSSGSNLRVSYEFHIL